MSIEVWEYIVKQASMIKESRLDEMKALAKECKAEKQDSHSGYEIVVKSDYLLNGDLVVKIEATRKILFGYLTQSISGGFEISVNGEITDYEKPSKVIERTSVRESWEAMANS